MASELEFDGTVQRGVRGARARRVQEWLCLHNHQVRIDGDFGPATEEAVRQFQGSVGLSRTGIVNRSTFDALVAPARAALGAIAPDGKALGELTVAYAKQHLAQHPLEVGGQNMGPWVRLYMNGREGSDWPWCAGFACFCLRQAREGVGVPMPFSPSVSCDSLAASGKQKGCFLREPKPAQRQQITPGSLFLSRRTESDWIHTGVVVRALEESFETIEGNTNDEGSREGYEVCARIRGFRGMDFLIV